MAEVRKKVTEDTYNTTKIKKNMKKKETKNVSKVESKKEVKKEVKKKSLWTRFLIFCNGVKSEFNKVHWTSKENMIKYSIATIIFIIFMAGFFYLIDVIFALIQTLLG